MAKKKKKKQKKVGSLVVLHMILNMRSKRLPNTKAKESREACRKKVTSEE